MIERVNHLIGEINSVSRDLMAERTHYSSQLIPVSAYVVLSTVEAFLRYPDIVKSIVQAMPPEEIGKRARTPGSQANSVFLWGIANFFLIGRRVMSLADPSLDSVERTHDVLDFWAKTSQGYRGNDHLHAANANDTIQVYDEETLKVLFEGISSVDEERRQIIRKANATLINYLFLLYFDTRVGHGDTGPYRLPDGRSVIVRDYYRLGESDFWWSGVSKEIPYKNLTAVFVIDNDVDLIITDFGTTVSDPENYLDGLSGFAIFTTDSGEIRELSDEELVEMAGVAKAAQKNHYRNIVKMSRDEKIACGSYVYFTFLRPFAEIAGISDDIDWTCPRDTPADLYPFITLDSEPQIADPDAELFTYYE